MDAYLKRFFSKKVLLIRMKTNSTLNMAEFIMAQPIFVETIVRVTANLKNIHFNGNAFILLSLFSFK